MHPLGQNLLLARRLVEAGVGFVTVNGWTGAPPGHPAGGGPPASSWDMHGSEMGMGNAFGNGPYGLGWCSPCLDQGSTSRGATPEGTRSHGRPETLCLG